MQIARLPELSVHYTDIGPKEGPTVVFANSLGTDLRLWDKVLPLMPPELRMIRYDKRGHGLTDVTPGPYAMGRLVSDAEALIEHLGVKSCVFVGLSIGGLIGQGLAAKRPDLVKALVLSDTAAKIGTAEMWAQRMSGIARGGIASMADPILERWFAKSFRDTDEFAAWRNMLIGTPVEGYLGCCAAISGTDFYTTTAGLKMPVLGIAGSDDGSTPPDLVRETVALAKNSRFHLIRGAGHLPCVEKPTEYADTLVQFLKEVGHV